MQGSFSSLTASQFRSHVSNLNKRADEIINLTSSESDDDKSSITKVESEQHDDLEVYSYLLQWCSTVK